MYIFEYNHFGEKRRFIKNDDYEFYYLNDDNTLGKKFNGRKCSSSKQVFEILDNGVYMFFDTALDRENYIENEKMKKQQEKELKNSYFNEKLKLIAELELQLKDLRYVDSNEELEEYKIKYDVFEKSRKQKEKNRIEKIEKCKIDITLYMKNNKDTFKLKNMLYDLKINNKTFYNYELDEFIKNLEKK